LVRSGSPDPYSIKLGRLGTKHPAQARLGEYDRMIYANILQMTSDFVENVSLSHRQGNGIPFGAI
jgi:hypothetical protein